MGIPESKNSGIDTLEECFDKDHYLSYTKDISYRYNSRGFRDYEWPEDLSDVVWCVGDSFTVGIGQPFEETWPQLLQKKSGKRCLNLGEDGCSNDTVALRIQEICKLHSPNLIVVMWSYLSRRRINNKNVHHDKKHFGNKEDMENFAKNFKIVNELPTSVINMIVPNAGISNDAITYFMKNISSESTYHLNYVEQVDRARDHHHFGFNTSELVTDLMIEKIDTVDNSSKYVL